MNTGILIELRYQSSESFHIFLKCQNSPNQNTCIFKQTVYKFLHTYIINFELRKEVRFLHKLIPYITLHGMEALNEYFLSTDYSSKKIAGVNHNK